MAVSRRGGITVDQASLRRVLAAIHLKGRDMKRKAGVFLFQRGEKIMAEAKDQEVPVDVGNLKNSGFVDPPNVERGEVSVTLGFGGTAAPYAIIVHEDLTARHTHGKAKYLEDPLRREVPHMAKDLAAAIKV